MHCAISRPLLDRLIAEAGSVGRAEICGLLVGEPGLITVSVPITNKHAKPELAFALDPAEHVAAARIAREAGKTVLGNYHSHPSGNAAPSPADAAQAFQEDVYWLIIAAGEARLWISRSGGSALNSFEPVELVLS